MSSGWAGPADAEENVAGDGPGPWPAGQAGADYGQLADEVSGACAADDPVVISRLYPREELRVPSGLGH